MARQNRKKQRSRGFTIPAPFLLMVLLVSAAALGYIWLGCCEEAIGRDIKRMETERDALARRVQNEESKWAGMKSPAGMELALARWGIEMDWPRHVRIVYLERRDVVTSLEDERDAARYARAGGGVGRSAF